MKLNSLDSCFVRAKVAFNEARVVFYRAVGGERKTCLLFASFLLQDTGKLSARHWSIACQIAFKHEWSFKPLIYLSKQQFLGLELPQ